MRGKRGQDVGLLIALLIIAAVVLILYLTGAGKQILALFGIGTSSTTLANAQTIANNCKTQCDLGEQGKYNYCCVIREVTFVQGGEINKITCDDSRLVAINGECSVSCANICVSLTCANKGGALQTADCGSGKTDIQSYDKSNYAGDSSKTCAGQLVSGAQLLATCDTNNGIKLKASDTTTEKPFCCLPKASLTSTTLHCCV